MIIFRAEIGSSVTEVSESQIHIVGHFGDESSGQIAQPQVGIPISDTGLYNPMPTSFFTYFG